MSPSPSLRGEVVGLPDCSPLFLEGHPVHEVDEWTWPLRFRERFKVQQLQALEQLAEEYLR